MKRTSMIPRTFSRRDFLKATAIGSGGLFLTRLEWAFADENYQPTWNPSKYSYTSWQSLYDKQWEFDYAGRSTHSVNCTGSCTWKVQVKDGVVWRWEQAADYPAIGPSVPDYNPRGCQKGACASDFHLGPKRLKYPLKRAGKRGEGKWQRLSWDQALTEIADRVVKIIQEHGPEYLNAFTPIPAMSPVAYASGSRLMNLLGGVSHTFYDWYCDLPPGEPITWGVQTDSAESADWYNSRLVIAWGSNVNATRIPDAQMLQKARLRKGTKVVVISTEYNPTAVHADRFVPIAPGTDLAVALAMDQTVIAERLYNTRYIKEQSDLPLLVREDNGRFLRESDLKKGGSDKTFYFWDSSHELTAVPKDSLHLKDLDPALEGRRQVDTPEGKIRVTTVFEKLKQELDGKTPEWAEQVSGVKADVIRGLAREFARTKPAMIIHGNGVNQWYHNDLANRAMILLTTLTGNVGKSGGGFNHYVGQEKIWTVLLARRHVERRPDVAGTEALLP
ncbi:MAG: molybdopterin-dependent oxidoreductase [Deltaproteobacteria bacterium]